MTFEDDLSGKLAELEREIKDLKYELAIDRQRIAKLEASGLQDFGQLKTSLQKILYEQALDRQRISKLEQYLVTKNDGHRRDFRYLAVELKNEVLRRGKQGMDYKDVVSYFRFKDHREAYRLMELTTQLFHEDVRLSQPRLHKQRKKVIPFSL